MQRQTRVRTLFPARGSRWVFTRLEFQRDRLSFFRSVTPMFSAAKDLMTSKAAKAYINDFIKRYGKVDELSIDSKRHRIDLRCQLAGEVSAIGITIEKYQIEQKSGKTYLEVLASSATRPWMQTAMRDHLHGRKIELPSWAAAAL